MKKILIILCATMFLTSCSTHKFNVNPDVSSEIIRISSDFQSELNVSDISISVKSLNNDRDYSYNSKKLYQVASLSKIYISTLIYLLQEKGVIDIDSNLNDFYKDKPKWNSIKIKNLLNHTSGILDYTKTPKFWYKVILSPYKIWSSKELIEFSYLSDSSFSVGTQYEYTNIEYEILIDIIEMVTKKSIQTNLIEYILIPNNLSNTYYFIEQMPVKFLKNMALGFDKRTALSKKLDPTYIRVSSTIGAMISSAADYSQFLKNLFDLKILNLQSLKKMKELISMSDGQLVLPWEKDLFHTMNGRNWTEVGAGSGINYTIINEGEKIWTHSGGNFGYESIFVINEKTGLIMTILINARIDDGESLKELVRNILSSI